MITIKEEFPGCDKWNRAMGHGGSDAIVLWLCIKAHAAEHLTDGFISEEDMSTLRGAPPASRRKRSIEALMACGRMNPDGTRGAGLLERVPNGYQLHNYLKHAESRAHSLERRRQAAERKRRQRRPGDVTHPVPRDILRDTHGDGTGTDAGVTLPKPNQTKPNQLGEEKREPATPAREKVPAAAAAPRVAARRRPSPVNRPWPEDFEPDETCVRLATDASIALTSELEKAKDWALSKGHRCKDWQAFVRNWIRRAAKDPRNGTKAERPTDWLFDRARRMTAEEKAKNETP